MAHLLASIARRRPRIIHFFLPPAYMTGAPLALLAGVPIRVMSRRSLNVYQDGHRFARAMERRLHPWMTAILGNSRSVMRDLSEEGVPSAVLGLIYNGVELSKFVAVRERSQIRASIGIPDATLVLVIVANVLAHKGYRDLIEALAVAAPQLPGGWRLLAVGRDYGLAGELKAKAAALGLAENILLLDVRDDVADILTACDIGLLCSHEEGFSNALLEGMAAGLPMIATDVGGNREALLHDETGLLVPPRDPKRLAEAIVRLANDPVLRARMGAAGRHRIEERFAFERCVEAYDELYRALLAGRSPCEIRAVAGVESGEALQANR